MSSGAGLASIWVSLDRMAARGVPAWRWLDMPTGELPAAAVRVGTVLADEYGDLVRVAAIGRRPGLVVLYTAPTGRADRTPTRSLRLRPTDPVRVPRAQPEGATP